MPRKGKAKRFIIPLIIIAAIVIVVLSYSLRNEKVTNAIGGSGIIEATEVDISAEVPARIVKLHVDEGDEVKDGDIIISLDENEYRKASEQAEAALRSAKAKLEDLLKGARDQEIEKAKADVDAAASSLKKADLDLERFKKLYSDDIVPIETVQDAQTAFDLAAARLRAAQEALKLLEAGSREDQIEAARWQVKEAESALEGTKIRLSYTEIRSPLDGRVLTKNFEEGELAVIGSPIFTIADVKNPWVKVYVGERNYGKVKLGMSAYIESDSFPGKRFEGTVTFISSEAEFTPKNIQTKEERVKLVFAIKIEIRNEEEELKPGMPVDVEIPINTQNE